MALSRIDGAELQRLLRSPTGPVARDLLRRANNVVNKAKLLCPVDTGRLRNSITAELVDTPVGPVARVGTNVDYAQFVHDGTGLYGPRAQRIQMAPGKVMRWKAKKGSPGGEGWVFATSSAGMRGVPFLKDALEAAND